MFIIGYYDNQGKCVVESSATSKDFAIRYCKFKNITYENRDYFYMEIPEVIKYEDWLEIISNL